MIFIHSIISFSQYQNLIDQTKQSINLRKLKEDTYKLNHTIYYPGDYYENKMMFTVRVPTFTINSPIIKGISFSNKMLGFIPKESANFQNISNHFAIKRIFRRQTNF